MTEHTHRRRPRGGGTIYPVGSGYRGSIFIVDATGRRVRKYVSGTHAEVARRLKTAQADADAAHALAASPTLEWWANHWLGTVSLRVRPSTLRLYRTALLTHIVPALGHQPLAVLRIDEINAALAAMGRQGLAPSTVALTRRILVVCLGDAETHGRIPRNVASDADTPLVESMERRRLTPPEVRELLALAATDPTTDLMVSLAIGTGARVGELCALDWADVDMEARTVSIRGTLGRKGVIGPTKSPRGRRTVALPSFAVAALRRESERRPGASGAVLADAAGRRLTGDRIGDRWRVLRERLGMGDMRFHDLRGTAATLALSAGVQPTEVARSLGHDPGVLMRTYAGAIPGGRALVADAIARAIEG